MDRIRVAAIVLTVALAACERPREQARVPPPPPEQPALQRFEATAYSIEGRTASGAHTHKGIVAADPKLLPLGTRIRLHDAGKYSGEYVVQDTGRGIRGREIDIYLANDAEAKQFGRRPVQVEVLR